MVTAPKALQNLNHRFLSARAIRGWYLVHKWTSLICTAFLLMLCITGLPLIFHHEIEHLSDDMVQAPELAGDAQPVSLDRVQDAVLATLPGAIPLYLVFDDEAHPNVVYVGTAASAKVSPEEIRYTPVDMRTAAILKDGKEPGGFMYVMLRLHVDMFAGLPGMLFLGSMGLLLIVAIVSGVVLYAPFMRRLPFGTVRRDRTVRTKWLDMHNMLGMVTLIWLLVVGATGVINTLEEPLIRAWRKTELADMTAPYRNAAPLEKLGSVNGAVATARRAAPDMKVRFVCYPGTFFATAHHFTIFMHGDAPLTSRLLKPALVDAETAALTDIRDLPWYLTVLLISQPLHFGDYGGLPLKIIWAALDIMTIIILGSGLYLWFGRRKRSGQLDARPSTVAGKERTA